MKKKIVLAAMVFLTLSTISYTSYGITKGSISAKEASKSEMLSKDSYAFVNKKNKTFVEYIKLIGLNKRELITSVGEEPTSIDEGGLEFSKIGIRVWLKGYGTGPVEQIFINKKNVDFNGAKIGDRISSFKNKFGLPVAENTGSAYSNFEYNGVVISVYYNPKTEVTFAVYILDEFVK